MDNLWQLVFVIRISCMIEIMNFLKKKNGFNGNREQQTSPISMDATFSLQLDSFETMLMLNKIWKKYQFVFQPTMLLFVTSILSKKLFNSRRRVLEKCALSIQTCFRMINYIHVSVSVTPKTPLNTSMNDAITREGLNIMQMFQQEQLQN